MAEGGDKGFWRRDFDGKPIWELVSVQVIPMMVGFIASSYVRDRGLIAYALVFAAVFIPTMLLGNLLYRRWDERR